MQSFPFWHLRDRSKGPRVEFFAPCSQLNAPHCPNLHLWSEIVMDASPDLLMHTQIESDTHIFWSRDRRTADAGNNNSAAVKLIWIFLMSFSACVGDGKKKLFFLFLRYRLFARALFEKCAQKIISTRGSSTFGSFESTFECLCVFCPSNHFNWDFYFEKWRRPVFLPLVICATQRILKSSHFSLDVSVLFSVLLRDLSGQKSFGTKRIWLCSYAQSGNSLIGQKKTVPVRISIKLIDTHYCLHSKPLSIKARKFWIKKRKLTLGHWGQSSFSLSQTSNERLYAKS